MRLNRKVFIEVYIIDSTVMALPGYNSRIYFKEIKTKSSAFANIKCGVCGVCE